MNSWIIFISLCLGFKFSPELLQQSIFYLYVLNPKIFTNVYQYGRSEVFSLSKICEFRIVEIFFDTLRVMSTFTLWVHLEITSVVRNFVIIFPATSRTMLVQSFGTWFKEFLDIVWQDFWHLQSYLIEF